jgi:hypothetical protein
MTIPWIIPAALAAAAILLVVRALGPRLFGGMLTRRHAFRCPNTLEEVDAELRESIWDGRHRDVARCSAFTPPEDVRCNKACTLLRLPLRGATRFRPLGELCSCWRTTRAASSSGA